MVPHRRTPTVAQHAATRARVWVSAEVKHYAWQTAPAASYVDRFTVSISDAYMELLLLFFAPPPIGKRSIVMSVSVCLCVFVCPRSHLRNYTSDLHRIFFVRVTYGRDSVLLWRCSDTLCTSGFMDDVNFAHKPRLLDVAAQLKRCAHAALGLAISCAQ